MRIYVACLASYNAGTLHGRWIDALQSVEAIEEEIAAMLKDSPEPGAEEWAIHDADGIIVSEYASIASVVFLAEMMDKHGDAWTDYVDWIGVDHATEEGFEESYCGAWDSLQAYAEDYLESTGAFDGAPDLLKNYFDFEAFTRDLGYDGYYFTTNGHVFRSC